ncbi:hypothetical protein D3C72_2428840 [compost metagenome]
MRELTPNVADFVVEIFDALGGGLGLGEKVSLEAFQMLEPGEVELVRCIHHRGFSFHVAPSGTPLEIQTHE